MNLRLPSARKRPLKVFTWHVHGSYLYYLSHVPCEFYLPIKPSKPEGYGGETAGFPWGRNVYEVDAKKVRDLRFDCILFQSKKNYLEDQYEIFSASQRDLPKIYLEHDPPRKHPTDTRHVVQNPKILLVHVTHFNDLMWNPGPTPTAIIEHGVKIPAGATYVGDLPKGIVVINNLKTRGRRLGLDVFEAARRQVPLDLVGTGSRELGGLGEIPASELPPLISRYRFFFNPIRYTSLGLAVCEAMMVGLPVVALATTQMPAVVENGRNGYADTDPQALIPRMRQLLDDMDLAQRLSAGARAYAKRHFSIDCFAQKWEQVLERWVRGNNDGEAGE